MYLAFPVFCYELKYPVSNANPRAGYLVGKVAMLLTCLAIIHIVYAN